MEFISDLIQCLFSGFQITVIVLFILKLIFKKQDLFWRQLFLLSNCVLLFASLAYGILYLTELYKEWYSQVTYEQQAFKWRVMGPYWYLYWIAVSSHFLIPQLLWFKKFRNSYQTSIMLMLLLFLFGPFMERLIIMLTSYYRDYLPSSWTYFYGPNVLDILGTFLIFTGLVLLLYFLFRKKLNTCTTL